jgi:hypothetical protein
LSWLGGARFSWGRWRVIGASGPILFSREAEIFPESPGGNAILARSEKPQYLIEIK